MSLLAAQRVHEPDHVAAKAGVERREGLVEKHQGPVPDERAGERHALALAAREFRRHPVPEARQPDPRQRAGDGRSLGGVQAEVRTDPDPDVLRGREVREQVVLLEQQRQRALRRAERQEVVAVEDKRPGDRAREARDGVQERGLAAA